MKILSFDPGERTGWARLDTEATPAITEFGTLIGKAKLYDFLQGGGLDRIDQIVVENYIVRQTKKVNGFDHSWSKVETLRYIGAIDLRAHQLGIPIFYYNASNKPAAYGMLGLKYIKGKSNMHHIDAIVHAYKHCEEKKLMPLNKIYGAMAGKS